MNPLIAAADGSIPLAAAQGHGPPLAAAQVYGPNLAAAQAHGPPPTRPTADQPTTEAEAYFAKLAVWVQRMLAEALKTNSPGLNSKTFDGKAPFEIGALPIQAREGVEHSSSYKAPWSQDVARISLTSTRRYDGAREWDLALGGLLIAENARASTRERFFSSTALTENCCSQTSAALVAGCGELSMDAASPVPKRVPTLSPRTRGGAGGEVLRP